MPFPFTLPTTSFLDLGQFFSSPTHPSLLHSATGARAQLRHVLKTHKRLDPAAQPGHLRTVLDAADAYLPYAASIEAALSGRDVSGEHVDIVLLREPDFEWRATLSARPPGARSTGGRWRQRGVDGELLFALHVRACALTLLAREELRPLLRTDVAPPEPEDRKRGAGAAMRLLMQAHAAHTRAAELASAPEGGGSGGAPDVAAQTQRGLAALALAEATAFAVLNDDPFPVAVAEQTNRHSREWMYRSAGVGVTRARILGRVCVAAAGHASSAAGALKNVAGLEAGVGVYCDSLYMVCRAKAARFNGIAAEGEGNTGEGIAWIQAAKKELGVKEKPLPRVLQNWKDKKEAERIEKGRMRWGYDAGRGDEGRVLDMVEKKWAKVNDTMTMQKIPSFQALLASMPSGRECQQPTTFSIPLLPESALAALRGPPEPKSSGWVDSDESGSNEGDSTDPVGAFPGTAKNYSAGVGSSTIF